MRELKQMNRARRAVGFLASAAIATAASHALAAARTWDGGGADGNWSTAANWAGDVAPNANDDLRFDGNANTATVNNYAADTSFNRLEFFDTAAAFSITGNRITLNGNIVSGVNGGASTAVHTVGIGLILNNNRVVQANGNTGIVIDGVISETGDSRSLTKQGAGTVTLAADNTFSGGLVVQAGTLALKHVGGAGTGTLTFSGASSFDNTSGAAMTVMNAVSLGTSSGNYAITFIGTNDLTFGGSSMTMSGNRAFNISAGKLTINGAISETSGSRSLTKQGDGTLVLAGDNLYSGGTIVEGGTLELAGSVTGVTTVRNTGLLKLSGSLGNGLALGLAGAGGQVQLLPGANLGTGTLNLTSGSFINSTGATYHVSNPVGSFGASFEGDDLVFTNTDWAINATTVVVNNTTTLAGKFNASGGAAFSLSGTGTLVWLGTNAATTVTTIHDGATLQVGNGGTAGDIGGGSVVNEGTLVFNRSDDFTYAQVISGGGKLIKDGPNTITFANAKTYTGPTEIAAGTLRLTGSGSIANTSAYTIAPGATLDISAKPTYSLADAPTTIGLTATESGFINGGSTTALTFGNTLTLNFTTASLIDGQQYDLFDMLSQTGDFDQVLLSGSFTGALTASAPDTWTGTIGNWTFTFAETTGTLTLTAVPEPTALGVLALLASTTLNRRRVKRERIV